MRCRELDIFKILDFFWIFREFFLDFFLEFFGGIFGRIFLGGCFWEEFYWRNFLGGILLEEFFGRNSYIVKVNLVI